MSLLNRTLFALVLAISMGTAASSYAQTGNDPVRAKEYYDRGAALYFEGQYGEAALEFMRAYDALPEPVFLYNLALSHWRLHNYDKAIEAAERALRDPDLDPELHANVAARAVVFYRLRRIEASVWTSPSEAVEEVVVDVEQPVAATRPRFGTIGWVGTGLAVAGAGVLAGFAVTELQLQAKVEDYKQAAEQGDVERYETLRAEIDSAQPVALGLLFGGIGLVAVGGGLILWEISRDDSAEGRVSWVAPAALRLAW